MGPSGSQVFCEDGERDLEKGYVPPPKVYLKSLSLPEPSFVVFPSASATSTPTLVFFNSGKALVVSTSSKALGWSHSSRRIDPSGKKKYVKQVTGRHNDTELHLAAQRGDLDAIRQILDEIDAQMVGTLGGADFDAEVAAIRTAMVNEVNELGDTALFAAA